jgi:hypothetical protein
MIEIKQLRFGLAKPHVAQPHRRDTPGNEKWSGRWESNPRLKLGKLGYYHYTTPAPVSDSSRLSEDQATSADRGRGSGAMGDRTLAVGVRGELKSGEPRFARVLVQASRSARVKTRGATIGAHVISF